MIALHRATVLPKLLLSLLLPVTAIAGETVAKVSESFRPAPGQAVATVPENEPARLAKGHAVAVKSPATAAYVPKTAYDNSPYRFNAGARFTAAEFDAWMKSRGIRVAKGKPAAAAAAATEMAVDNTTCNTQAVNDC